MQITELLQLFATHPELAAACQQVKRGSHVLLRGLHASARAMVMAQMLQRLKRTIVLVLTNAEDAQYMMADLQTLTDKQGAMLFPISCRRRQGRDEALAVQRTEVLSRLNGQTSPFVVVTYPEALAEDVPARETLSSNTISLHVGQEIQISRLAELLMDQQMERVDFVFEPGQFAIRGGIVDVYSYSHDDPYRIDFFGNEIDSIREFDIETQLSKTRVEAIDIVGQQTNTEGRAMLTDYLPDDVLWVSNDWSMVRFKLDGLLSLPLEQLPTIEMRDQSSLPTHVAIQFDTLPQPVFHKQFSLLIADLQQHIDQGYRIYVLADQRKQTDRLAAIFSSEADNMGCDPVKFIPIENTLHAGWIDHKLKTCCYTDHEIFERYHRVSMQSENARRGKAVITLREINQLQLGDFVVHSDHGIAKFGGLVTTSINGRPQEMIKLVFRDNAYVFVSIHNLHRISKYKGKEGNEPTISKLGSGQWERLKERTKDKVKDIARDLIRLYATRKQQKGFAYTPDGYMQQELEASFLYEDTPDQAKATADIKRDLESIRPMDRLVCGDVGFGKTEVAMRAAFKVATDGKQVAVLVPTTVLALQHYNTFRERMRDFPVRIEMLSRAKTPKETKQIITDLQSGKIDILIGTHKLVSKTVTWHDLGLLIIDEEQKFGVSVKDKLKQLRTNVDVLTLTATPIPRTLQFSLLGARDLSIINTPPPNRFPVQTELITNDDEDIIREAINLEMARNGQIFVVNNRIDMLPRMEKWLRRLCPEARIITAHGQMPPEEMERRLEDFINYDYDILLSTTIIESGVDIPNVNTMIIYSAQHYGLSDLHQLRGRVGRSNRKAYCYLVTPDRELLTADARRRLEALSTFSELGAGFNLAMQDLDIRGAGNMLGAEQSGFIADLGYETYQRILNEAVQELREEMMMEMPEEENATEHGSIETIGNWATDCQLESDLTLGFPSVYVENISERITLYRELDNLRNEEQMAEFRTRMIDRFGPLPQEAEELLSVVRLRWLCCQMGIEKILMKQERLVLYFVHDKDAYWHSDMFGRIVEWVCRHPQRCLMVAEKDRKGEPTGRRYVTIQNVKTIAGAMHLLSKLLSDTDPTITT